MDQTESFDELTSAVQSISMEAEDAAAATPPSSPAERSIPEQILDMRVDASGVRIYLVKWFGFSAQESTWITESTLHDSAIFCPVLLAEFHKKINDGEHSGGPTQDMEISESDEDLSAELNENSDNVLEFIAAPEVLGIIDNGVDQNLIVRWHGMENVEVIPKSLAIDIWPDIVEKYYENYPGCSGAAD